MPGAPQPLELSKPVEKGELKSIDAETVGLIGADTSGLGAAMWKDTPREMVDHLLPAILLPTASPTLNDVARRFLLTTANAPEGASQQSLTSDAHR